MKVLSKDRVIETFEDSQPQTMDIDVQSMPELDTKLKCYGVAIEKLPGIYLDWEKAKAQTVGVKNQKHQKFQDLYEAWIYVHQDNYTKDLTIDKSISQTAQYKNLLQILQKEEIPQKKKGKEPIQFGTVPEDTIITAMQSEIATLKEERDNLLQQNSQLQQAIGLDRIDDIFRIVTTLRDDMVATKAQGVATLEAIHQTKEQILQQLQDDEGGENYLGDFLNKIEEDHPPTPKTTASDDPVPEPEPL